MNEELLVQNASSFPIWIFLLIMICTFLASLFEKKDLSGIDFRKNQANDFANQDTIRQRVIDYTTKNVKYDKRFDIETLCLQAGKNWTYADFVIYSWITSIVCGIIVGFIFNNPFMGVLFCFLGHKLPKQVLVHKKIKRLKTLDMQIGPFMYMVIKRYETTRDFGAAIDYTAQEFKGYQPLYGELQKTVADIAIKMPVSDALDNFARRAGNPFLARLSDYYKIAYRLGTEDVRKKLLMQAYDQYEEDRKLKELLKKEIAEPVRDAYIIIATVPIFALFGAFALPGYTDFMLHNNMGRIGVAIITSVLLGAIWFVNAKIAAPLD